MKVLINAYTCSPDHGSEPGMAWNWIIHLSEYCELFVITESEFKNRIIESLELLNTRNPIHFHFLSVSDNVRKMCWNQGDWRFYYHYRKWQRKAFELSNDIMLKTPIDLIHQLNMIGYREPGYLWKHKHVPFVWGPIGGVEKMPKEFLRNAPIFLRLFLNLKNVINWVQIRFHPRVRKAIHRSDYILSAVPAMRDALQEVWSKQSLLISETGCNLNKTIIDDNVKYESGLHLIWVGKFDYRKQLQLALDVMISLKDRTDIFLHIVGGGTKKEERYFKNYSSSALSSNIIWHGKKSKAEVHLLMQKCHLLFFTSIMEATSTVVVEAIENNLPVLCFDTCGFGNIIDSSIGFKIPLLQYNTSVMEFKRIINELNITELNQLALNCRHRVGELSWSNKARIVSQIYNHLNMDYITVSR